MTGIDRTRVATFLGVLVGLALVFEAVAFALGVPLVSIASAYMFTPMVAGAATVWRSDVGFREVGLRLGAFRWHLIAAVAPVVLAFSTLAVSLLVPGIAYNPGIDLVPWLDLPGGGLGLIATIGLVLVLGVTVNAVLAFGEEFGWRGYLLWELAPLGFWRASILIGAVWGLWHAPVIVEGYNYASFPYLGVLVMIPATITFSVLYTYLVVRARSVLAAVFFHGVFNASGGVVIALTLTDSPALGQLVASPVGVASMVVFLLVWVIIYATGTPDLDRSVFEAPADALTGR